jgi:hypothetical protein
MIAMSMLAFAAASIAGVLHQFRSEEKVAKAYVEDLEGLRLALRSIENALDGESRLLRNGVVVAESIGSFSIRQRSDFATVRISPAPRAQGRATSPRALVCQVHLRRMEEVR